MPMVVIDSWRFRGEVKKLLKSICGEGSYCPDDEFLIDVAFALPYPVNLTH